MAHFLALWLSIMLIPSMRHVVFAGASISSIGSTLGDGSTVGVNQHALVRINVNIQLEGVDHTASAESIAQIVSGSTEWVVTIDEISLAASRHTASIPSSSVSSFPGSSMGESGDADPDLIEIEHVLTLDWSIVSNKTFYGEGSTEVSFLLPLMEESRTTSGLPSIRTLVVALWEIEIPSILSTNKRRKRLLLRRLAHVPRTKRSFDRQSIQHSSMPADSVSSQRRPVKPYTIVELAAISKCCEASETTMSLKIDNIVSLVAEPKIFTTLWLTMFVTLAFTFSRFLLSTRRTTAEGGGRQQCCDAHNLSSEVRSVEGREEDKEHDGEVTHLDENATSNDCENEGDQESTGHSQEGAAPDERDLDFGLWGGAEDEDDRENTGTHIVENTQLLMAWSQRKNSHDSGSSTDEGLDLPPPMERHVVRPLPGRGITFEGEIERFNSLNLSSPLGSRTVRSSGSSRELYRPKRTGQSFSNPCGSPQPFVWDRPMLFNSPVPARRRSSAVQTSNGRARSGSTSAKGGNLMNRHPEFGSPKGLLLRNASSINSGLESTINPSSSTENVERVEEQEPEKLKVLESKKLPSKEHSPRPPECLSTPNDSNPETNALCRAMSEDNKESPRYITPMAMDLDAVSLRTTTPGQDIATIPSKTQSPVSVHSEANAPLEERSASVEIGKPEPSELTLEEPKQDLPLTGKDITASRCNGLNENEHASKTGEVNTEETEERNKANVLHEDNKYASTVQHEVQKTDISIQDPSTLTFAANKFDENISTPHQRSDESIVPDARQTAPMNPTDSSRPSPAPGTEVDNAAENGRGETVSEQVEHPRSQLCLCKDGSNSMAGDSNGKITVSEENFKSPTKLSDAHSQKSGSTETDEPHVSKASKLPFVSGESESQIDFNSKHEELPGNEEQTAKQNAGVDEHVAANAEEEDIRHVVPERKPMSMLHELKVEKEVPPGNISPSGDVEEIDEDGKSILMNTSATKCDVQPHLQCLQPSRTRTAWRGRKRKLHGLGADEELVEDLTIRYTSESEDVDKPQTINSVQSPRKKSRRGILSLDYMDLSHVCQQSGAPLESDTANNTEKTSSFTYVSTLSPDSFATDDPSVQLRSMNSRMGESNECPNSKSTIQNNGLHDLNVHFQNRRSQKAVVVKREASQSDKMHLQSRPKRALMQPDIVPSISLAEVTQNLTAAPVWHYTDDQANGKKSRRKIEVSKTGAAGNRNAPKRAISRRKS